MKVQACVWLIVLTIATSMKFPVLSMYMAVLLAPIVAVALLRWGGVQKEKLKSEPDLDEALKADEVADNKKVSLHSNRLVRFHKPGRNDCLVNDEINYSLEDVGGFRQ